MNITIDHRALRDRIEYLEEENRQLRERLASKDGDDFCTRAHRAFGLTKAEGRILAVLVRCGLAETSALYDALYGFNELDEPEKPNEAVRSHMKRMRRKLRPAGVEIETHYGFGFALGDEGRAAVRRAVEAA